MRMLGFTVLCAVLSSDCGSTSPTAPSPAPTPTPIDTSVKVLVDGAGNPGPVTVRLLEVIPAAGSSARDHLSDGVMLVSFRAEVCMTAVPNPTNSRYLAEMRVLVFGSADGVRPLGPTLAQGEGHEIYRLQNGGPCVIVKRMPFNMGGTPGSQFIFFQPRATHLMFTASYGTNLPEEMAFNWPQEACPAPQVIAAGPWPYPPGTPNCMLRTGYSLDYKW